MHSYYAENKEKLKRGLSQFMQLVKGNYAHMAQILTSIAIYEVLQKHGKSEAVAYRIVSEEMWKFLDPSAMQKLARKSFFLKRLWIWAAAAGAMPGSC